VQRGGFHIWPEGMHDPTGSHLSQRAGIPLPVDETVESKERVAEPVGAQARTRQGASQRPSRETAGKVSRSRQWLHIPRWPTCRAR
jgi:hypothetical protein